MPVGQSFRKRGERPQVGVLDRDIEPCEALLGLGAIACLVDRAERFLESPCLDEERLAFKQRAEAAAFAFGETFGGFEQAMAGVVELGVPPVAIAAAPRALGTAGGVLALALAADAASAVLTPRTR